MKASRNLGARSGILYAAATAAVVFLVAVYASGAPLVSPGITTASTTSYKPYYDYPSTTLKSIFIDSVESFQALSNGTVTYTYTNGDAGTVENLGSIFSEGYVYGPPYVAEGQTANFRFTPGDPFSPGEQPCFNMYPVQVGGGQWGIDDDAFCTNILTSPVNQTEAIFASATGQYYANIPTYYGNVTYLGMNITMVNDGSSPITSLATFTEDDFMFNGSAVSATNPLPPAQFATCSIAVEPISYYAGDGQGAGVAINAIFEDGAAAYVTLAFDPPQTPSPPSQSATTVMTASLGYEVDSLSLLQNGTVRGTFTSGPDDQLAYMSAEVCQSDQNTTITTGPFAPDEVLNQTVSGGANPSPGDLCSTTVSGQDPSASYSFGDIIYLPMAFGPGLDDSVQLRSGQLTVLPNGTSVLEMTLLNSGNDSVTGVFLADYGSQAQPALFTYSGAQVSATNALPAGGTTSVSAPSYSFISNSAGVQPYSVTIYVYYADGAVAILGVNF